MTHTPTPWSAKSDECTKIKDRDGHTIASLFFVSLEKRRSVEEVSANAAFIVRAVNAHDDLVAALEHIQSLPCDHGHFESCARSAIEIARAALAKAEGK